MLSKQAEAAWAAWTPQISFHNSLVVAAVEVRAASLAAAVAAGVLDHGKSAPSTTSTRFLWKTSTAARLRSSPSKSPFYVLLAMAVEARKALSRLVGPVTARVAAQCSDRWVP